ncbi:MAG: flavoprotein, partial [Candidatus Hodarchaeales archaeon]
HKDLSYFPSEALIPDTAYHPVLWCITGGGHKFQENLNAFLELTRKSVPIILIFSNAGALVANRYGFFYQVKDIRHVASSSFFIFENERVLSHNISQLLDQGDINYAFHPDDPSFSHALSLVNKYISCIIASPLTTNSAAKIGMGISDTLITNILVAGIKAKKKVALFPTDVDSKIIKSKLPIKYRVSSSKNIVDITVCKYGALKRNQTEVIYLSEYCVGCRLCVNKYPSNFTYEEEYVVTRRPVDEENINKLAKECIILSSPLDIPKFVFDNLSKI